MKNKTQYIQAIGLIGLIILGAASLVSAGSKGLDVMESTLKQVDAFEKQCHYQDIVRGERPLPKSPFN